MPEETNSSLHLCNRRIDRWFVTSYALFEATLLHFIDIERQTLASFCFEFPFGSGQRHSSVDR